MKTKKKSGFPGWLEGKFISREAELGHRLTLDDYANEIGISRPMLSQYINGSKYPSIETLKVLIPYFGFEVLSVLGIGTKDNILDMVLRSWSIMPNDAKEEIAKIVKPFIDSDNE